MSVRTRAVFLVAVATFGAEAQTLVPVTIAGAPTCAACSVRMDRALTLRAPPSEEPFGSNSRVARSARGQFVVLSVKRDRLLLFDEQGRFVREVGRPGDGPGEFRRLIRAEFVQGDSLLVIEHGRTHIFSPALTHVRTTPMPDLPGPVAHLEDGSVVAWTDRRYGGGYPLRLIAPTGMVVRAFGVVGMSSVDPSCRSCLLNLSSGAIGSLRLFPQNRYSWQEWTSSGVPGQEYVVAGSPWFSDWADPGNYIQGTSPVPSSIAAVIQDSPMQALVLGTRSPPNWKPVPPSADTGVIMVDGGVVFRGGGAMDAYTARHEQDYQTVIDVIDLSRRAVVTTGFFEGRRTPLGNGYAAAFRPSASNGEWDIEIYRITVVRP